MSRRGQLLAIIFCLALGARAEAPATLPALTLFDPLGTEFTDAQLKARGAVIVVTAPTHAQGDAQKAWSAAFKSLSKDKSGPVIVMLEDMSQSWFRAVVLAEMKKTYRAGASPVLLLDETGATRKAFGVADNATVAFAFAAGGKRVAVETGAASRERALALIAAAAQTRTPE